MVDDRTENRQTSNEKKRRQRNLAIALMLGAFIVIVFMVTILRIGGSVAERAF